MRPFNKIERTICVLYGLKRAKLKGYKPVNFKKVNIFFKIVLFFLFIVLTYFKVLKE